MVLVVHDFVLYGWSPERPRHHQPNNTAIHPAQWRLPLRHTLALTLAHHSKTHWHHDTSHQSLPHQRGSLHRDGHSQRFVLQWRDWRHVRCIQSALGQRIAGLSSHYHCWWWSQHGEVSAGTGESHRQLHWCQHVTVHGGSLQRYGWKRWRHDLCTVYLDPGDVACSHSPQPCSPLWFSRVGF